MEILAESEYVRLEGAMTDLRCYLLGHLDGNHKLGSLITWDTFHAPTKRYNVMDIYEQLHDHLLKITGTSMMSLVVKLVSLSKYDSNDKYCSRKITNLRDLKQK